MRIIFTILLTLIYLTLSTISFAGDLSENIQREEGISKIRIPTCEKLRKFPLATIGIFFAYGEAGEAGKADEVLEEYFGLKSIKWNDSDFEMFNTILIECRKNDPTFFASYDETYFPEAVKEVSYELKEGISKLKSKLKLDEEAETELSQLNANARPLIEKAKSLTINNDELDQLKILLDEVEKSYKKHSKKGVGLLAGDIETALEDFTKNKAYAEFKARADVLIGKADSLTITSDELNQLEALADEAYKLGGDYFSYKVKILAVIDIYKREIANRANREMANKLIPKYAKSGPPVDFLSASFQTYAGASTSGDLGAVVIFFHKLPGAKKWEKKGDIWVLHQTVTDAMTGKKTNAMYGFYDLRKKQGSVWLERAIIDNKEFPSAQLYYLVVRVLGNPD